MAKASKYFLRLLFSCVLMGLWPLTHALASDLVTDPLSFPSDRQTFQQSLEEIRDLDQFKASITVQDLTKQAPVSQTQVWADQEAGSLYIETRYPRKITGKQPQDTCYLYDDQSFTLQVYADQDLSKWYVNHFDLLEQKGYWKDQALDQDEQVSLKAFRGNFLEFTVQEGQKFPENLVDLFLLRPSQEALGDLDDRFISQGPDYIRMTASRVDVPLNFFKRDSYLNLDYNFLPGGLGELKLNLNNEHLTMTDQSNMNDYSFLDELVQYLNGSYQGRHQVHRWSSSMTTDKLLNLWLTIQPQKQIYHLRTIGIEEKMALNVFIEKTATFKPHTYQLDIYIEPSQEDVLSKKPSLTITPEALLERAIKPVE